MKTIIQELFSGKRVLAGIIFIVLLGVHLYFVFQGLDHSLGEVHAFRQTQTALTAYYLADEGWRLDYLTPVLGYPWSIPFEFPVYQSIVAFIHSFFDIKLDVVGRLVSISAFYAMLIVVFKMFKFLSYSKSERLILTAVLLFNPILLFWSRTFMIESTATFFSMMYLLLMVNMIKQYSQEGKVNYISLLLILIVGCLAALTKVTTFALYLLCSFMVIVSILYDSWGKYVTSPHIRNLGIISVFVFLLPMVVIRWWNSYADEIKNQSYLGSKITSGNLVFWNFGSLKQRMSLDIWDSINNNCEYYIVIILFICVLSIVLCLKNRIYILIFSISGLAGPLVFTNLYHVHNYYSSANTPFFSIAIGLFLISILKIRKRLYVFIPASLFIFYISWLSYDSYLKHYNSYQKTNYQSLRNVSIEIAKLTSTKDVILVKGMDWSSEVPYYSSRKTVCVPDFVIQELNSISFLDKLKSSNITSYAIFSLADSIQVDAADRNVIRYYGLSGVPHKLSDNLTHCLLFKKGDLLIRKSE